MKDYSETGREEEGGIEGRRDQGRERESKRETSFASFASSFVRSFVRSFDRGTRSTDPTSPPTTTTTTTTTTQGCLGWEMGQRQMDEPETCQGIGWRAVDGAVHRGGTYEYDRNRAWTPRNKRLTCSPPPIHHHYQRSLTDQQRWSKGNNNLPEAAPILEGYRTGAARVSRRPAQAVPKRSPPCAVLHAHDVSSAAGVKREHVSVERPRL